MQDAENGDDAGALNPERPVKLTAGDKFAPIRFGGGEGIECRGGNGVVSGQAPVDTLRHYLP
ncbi:MAG: hypothetical protein OXH37_12005 [Gammaproteobacteria bacterium]|nr:hypothetical protein [Gammaproteobacteria bacterium]MCZ0954067.1 hypothetical protein [Rhodospirillaceae bacterium]MDE0360291.1 hypothetical protein [Rhodospirillaceae bacterium]